MELTKTLKWCKTNLLWLCEGLWLFWDCKKIKCAQHSWSIKTWKFSAHQNWQNIRYKKPTEHKTIDLNINETTSLGPSCICSFVYRKQIQEMDVIQRVFSGKVCWSVLFALLRLQNLRSEQVVAGWMTKPETLWFPILPTCNSWLFKNTTVIKKQVQRGVLLLLELHFYGTGDRTRCNLTNKLAKAELNWINLSKDGADELISCYIPGISRENHKRKTNSLKKYVLQSPL